MYSVDIGLGTSGTLNALGRRVTCLAVALAGRLLTVVIDGSDRAIAAVEEHHRQYGDAGLVHIPLNIEAAIHETKTFPEKYAPIRVEHLDGGFNEAARRPEIGRLLMLQAGGRLVKEIMQHLQAHQGQPAQFLVEAFLGSGVAAGGIGPLLKLIRYAAAERTVNTYVWAVLPSPADEIGGEADEGMPLFQLKANAAERLRLFSQDWLLPAERTVWVGNKPRGIGKKPLANHVFVVDGLFGTEDETYILIKDKADLTTQVCRGITGFILGDEAFLELSSRSRDDASAKNASYIDRMGSLGFVAQTVRRDVIVAEATRQIRQRLINGLGVKEV